MKSAQKFITAAMMGLTLIASAPALVPVAASAQAITADSFGVAQAAATGLPNRDLRLVVASILRVLFGLVGMVMVTLIIYAGFLWMTAGGEEEQISKAKAWLSGSAIGLALMLLAFTLTNYIITQLVAATTGTGSGAAGI